MQSQKFKDVDTELKATKQQLENEKASHLEQCSELRLKIKHLQQELNQFKALCHEQTTAIAEMKINSAQQIKQNTELNHKINKQNIEMEELKLENELKSHSLVQQIENDNNKLLKKMYESFPLFIVIMFEMNCYEIYTERRWKMRQLRSMQTSSN